MTDRRKTRNAVQDALNGDINKVDAPVRRALFAICTELDEHAERMTKTHEEILAEMEENFTRLEKTMAKGIALLITTTVTFLLALGTALLGTVFS